MFCGNWQIICFLGRAKVIKGCLCLRITPTCALPWRCFPMQLNTATDKTDGERRNSTTKPLPEPLKPKFTIMQGRTWQSSTFSSRNLTQKGFARRKKCRGSATLLLPVVYLDSAWASALLAWPKLPIIASFVSCCCFAKRGASSRKHKLRKGGSGTQRLIIHRHTTNPAIRQVSQNFGLVLGFHVPISHWPILNQRPLVGSYW